MILDIIEASDRQRRLPCGDTHHLAWQICALRLALLASSQRSAARCPAKHQQLLALRHVLLSSLQRAASAVEHMTAGVGEEWDLLVVSHRRCGAWRLLRRLIETVRG